MNIIKNIENFYQTHVFCCVNKRSDECCSNKGSEELQEYMKQQCKEMNLVNVRINKSGCLGRCKLGKVMVIYPEGIWYHYDTKEDIDLIITSHLQHGKILDHLILTNEQTKVKVIK